MMSDCHDLAAVKCGVRVTLHVIVSLASDVSRSVPGDNAPIRCAH